MEFKNKEALKKEFTFVNDKISFNLNGYWVTDKVPQDFRSGKEAPIPNWGKLYPEYEKGTVAGDLFYNKDMSNEISDYLKDKVYKYKQTKLSFGKYKGYDIFYAYTQDPGYYAWLLDQPDDQFLRMQMLATLRLISLFNLNN